MSKRANAQGGMDSLLTLPIEVGDALPSEELARRLIDGSGEPTDSQPGLRLFLDARDVAALTQNLGNTFERFNQARTNLQSEVAERTRDLEATRERLEVVIDSIADGLIACNEAGVIESFNRAAERLFRCDHLEAIGKPISSFFPDRTELKSIFSESGEALARRPDGSRIRVEGSLRPMKMPEGVLSVIAVRDVTEVRYTQKILREQAFLIERSKSFVVSLDTGVRIDWCNPCFEALTGYTRAQMQGRRPADFLLDPECPADVVERVQAALKANESFSEEAMLRHANGRPFWVHVEVHPMLGEDGSLEKYMALGIDITDRKREERQHVDFVSMVSHELRTPLTVVSGALDALAMGTAGEMPEQSQALIEMGQRNCAQLSTLIEDLLDVNKLEAGVIGFQSQVVDIIEPVSEAARSMVPVLNERAMKLTSDVRVVGARVFVDPNRLRQVVVNLLSNSIKFSSIGGEIILSIELRQDQVRVTVRDFGQGIPAEFQPHVFEKFSRDVQVQASGKEGFGLGLCISKGLVAQMGGDISFASLEGMGASFHIDLPLHSLVCPPQVVQ